MQLIIFGKLPQSIGLLTWFILVAGCNASHEIILPANEVEEQKRARVQKPQPTAADGVDDNVQLKDLNQASAVFADSSPDFVVLNFDVEAEKERLLELVETSLLEQEDKNRLVKYLNEFDFSRVKSVRGFIDGFLTRMIQLLPSSSVQTAEVITRTTLSATDSLVAESAEKNEIRVKVLGEVSQILAEEKKISEKDLQTALSETVSDSGYWSEQEAGGVSSAIVDQVQFEEPRQDEEPQPTEQQAEVTEIPVAEEDPEANEEHQNHHHDGPRTQTDDPVATEYQHDHELLPLESEIEKKFPKFLSAGAGCKNLDCFWFSVSNLEKNSTLLLKDPENGAVLHRIHRKDLNWKEEHSHENSDAYSFMLKDFSLISKLQSEQGLDLRFVNFYKVRNAETGETETIRTVSAGLTNITTFGRELPAEESL